MTWEAFLQEKPVFTTARETLTDEDFLAFLQKIYKAPTPEGFTESPAWHLFEEIGWPEGQVYCKEGTEAYVLMMAGPQTRTQTISPRLINRQTRWKSKKAEHISAHEILKEFLPNSILTG